MHEKSYDMICPYNLMLFQLWALLDVFCSVIPHHISLWCWLYAQWVPILCIPEWGSWHHQPFYLPIYYHWFLCIRSMKESQYDSITMIAGGNSYNHFGLMLPSWKIYFFLSLLHHPTSQSSLYSIFLKEHTLLVNSASKF